MFTTILMEGPQDWFVDTLAIGSRKLPNYIYKCNSVIGTY
jgi:hypothetical protein